MMMISQTRLRPVRAASPTLRYCYDVRPFWSFSCVFSDIITTWTQTSWVALSYWCSFIADDGRISRTGHDVRNGLIFVDKIYVDYFLRQHTPCPGNWTKKDIQEQHEQNAAVINIFYQKETLLGAMQICIARTNYGNVSGWVTGCLSQPVLYKMNKPILKLFRPSGTPIIKHLGPLTPILNSKGNPFIGGV